MLRGTHTYFSYIAIDQVAHVVKAKLSKAAIVDHVLLVDVRSTTEVAESGMIPTAVNVPLPILREMLSARDGAVSDEEFESTLGVPRPQSDTAQLIFYCAHGVRSAVAVDIAEEVGFHNPRNFSGSWAQWAHTYGPQEHTPGVDSGVPAKRIT